MSQRAWILTGVVAVVVAAAVFLLTRPSDEDQIRDTVTAYYDALADSDYAGACDQLAPAERKILTAGTTHSCPQAVEAALAETDRDLGDLHGIAIQSVRVDGPRAFATVTGGHTLELEDDSGWRILDPGQ